MAECVLALDLGTTAYKAAAVDGDGVIGRVTVVAGSPDYAGGRVTCDPDSARRRALRALRGAARSAREHGAQVTGIGISSQAQTFVPVGPNGEALGPAVVWTDGDACAEAAEAGRVLPGFAASAGFLSPSPLQFVSKAMRYRREGGRASQLLLLNEWVIAGLTGEAYGDETNQGMGGLYDIARRTWNHTALALAGLGEASLARVAPAAAISTPLETAARRTLGLEAVPVFSCGNDQSCAAVGGGLRRTGDLFCNFGTAMVAMTLRDAPTVPASPEQIAGISPLPDRWFLLGVESECGNVIEWAARLLWPRGGVPALLAAARRTGPSNAIPEVRLHTGGRLDLQNISLGANRHDLARAFVEHFGARFATLAGGLAPGGVARRTFAGGGLSRSAHWLQAMERAAGLELEPTPGEHPGLVGIERIIRIAGGK